MGQTVLSFDWNFQKILENKTHRISLIKVDENFEKVHYGSNLIIFCNFLFFHFILFLLLLLLFFFFCLDLILQKSGKQQDLRDVMVQAQSIKFTIFKWKMQFNRSLRFGTVLSCFSLLKSEHSIPKFSKYKNR